MSLSPPIATGRRHPIETKKNLELVKTPRKLRRRFKASEPETIREESHEIFFKLRLLLLDISESWSMSFRNLEILQGFNRQASSRREDKLSLLNLVQAWLNIRGGGAVG